MNVLVQVVKWGESPNFLEAVDQFYKRVGYSYDLNSRAKNLETLIVAQTKKQGRVVGVLRICLEEGRWILRGVQVDPCCRRLGIGKKILAKIDSAFEQTTILYCIAYTHLERFYKEFRFEKILENQAPMFLRDRLTNYQRCFPTNSYIIMRRGL